MHIGSTTPPRDKTNNDNVIHQALFLQFSRAYLFEGCCLRRVEGGEGGDRPLLLLLRLGLTLLCVVCLSSSRPGTIFLPVYALCE